MNERSADPSEVIMSSLPHAVWSRFLKVNTDNESKMHNGHFI
jgi:hypothetical protein